MNNPDQYFMQHALELAQQARAVGEVPVGAVVVKDGAIIAEGFNQPISQADPTAHAEIVAMRAAAKALNNYRLNDCTLYVTLEPCSMCAGAMVHARVKRLVYGAADPRTGSVDSVMDIVRHPVLNHQLDVSSGVLAEESAVLLREFFRAKR